jgi:hypothetical protein
MGRMLDWIRANQVLTGGLFALSALMFVGGLILMPLVVARIRPDYFLHDRPPEGSWRRRHPVIRLSVLIVKNGLGLVLLLAGLAMLVLPGQGVLTILVGISLLNFPGKRRLELKIVRQAPVLRAINWMRARAGRPPLRLPAEPGGETGPRAPRTSAGKM